MNKPPIIFLTFGQFDMNCLNLITDKVMQEFQCRVIIKPFEIDLIKYYDQIRRQYDANLLLKTIIENDDNYGGKKLGLFQVDLFIPILTYIFGQAIFRGDAGVVSLFRLKNEQYGLKPNHNLLASRFKKVIIHELGHLFGLKHCHVPNCIMRSSTYVEDIDQKEAHFCMNCKRILFDKPV